MHQTEQPYLKRRNINKYLKRLSEVMIENNLGPCNILVVGGAAVALGTDVRRSTVDIDICIRERSQLYYCCLQVAKEFNIPNDWINADVMRSQSFSYRLFEKAVHYRTFGGVLNVYIPADIDLFCMKLVSFRQKDLTDLIKLASNMKKRSITRQDILNNFNYLYNDMYLLGSRARNFLNKQFR